MDNPGMPEDTVSLDDTFDPLRPEYQQLLDQAFTVVTTGEAAKFEAWLDSVPTAYQKQLLDDTITSLHNHKVHIIRSLLGPEAVTATSRQQKDALIRMIAQSVSAEQLNQEVQSVDSTLRLQNPGQLDQWREYARRVVHGMDTIFTLRARPLLQEYQRYLDRFRSWKKDDVELLRKQLEEVFFALEPGAAIDKDKVQKLSVVLAKAGFPQQLVADLSQPDRHAQLLRLAHKLYLILIIVDQYFGDSKTQEAALLQHLRRLQSLRPASS